MLPILFPKLEHLAINRDLGKKRRRKGREGERRERGKKVSRVGRLKKTNVYNHQVGNDGLPFNHTTDPWTGNSLRKKEREREIGAEEARLENQGKFFSFPSSFLGSDEMSREVKKKGTQSKNFTEKKIIENLGSLVTVTETFWNKLVGLSLSLFTLCSSYSTQLLFLLSRLVSMQLTTLLTGF